VLLKYLALHAVGRRRPCLDLPFTAFAHGWQSYIDPNVPSSKEMTIGHACTHHQPAHADATNLGQQKFDDLELTLD
jgi:hypothetical protein